MDGLPPDSRLNIQFAFGGKHELPAGAEPIRRNQLRKRTSKGSSAAAGCAAGLAAKFVVINLLYITGSLWAACPAPTGPPAMEVDDGVFTCMCCAQSIGLVDLADLPCACLFCHSCLSEFVISACHVCCVSSCSWAIYVCLTPGLTISLDEV